MQVNKIRDVGTSEHKNMIVTHTDANELFVWNMDTQPPAGKPAKARYEQAQACRPSCCAGLHACRCSCSSLHVCPLLSLQTCGIMPHQPRHQQGGRGGGGNHLPAGQAACLCRGPSCSPTRLTWC